MHCKELYGSERRSFGLESQGMGMGRNDDSM